MTSNIYPAIGQILNHAFLPFCSKRKFFHETMNYIPTWKLSEGIAGDRDVVSLEGSRDNCSIDGTVELE